MTLDEYRKFLGWSARELARQANLDNHTVGRALRGEPISPGVARALAEALTQGLHNGTVVHPGMIKGLNIIN